MTTRSAEHDFDEAVDRRLRGAGARLEAEVVAEVDVNRRLHELTSAPRARRGWWMMGLAAGVTAAAVVVGVVVSSPPPVRIDPVPEFAGPPDDGVVDEPPGREQVPPDPDPESVDPNGTDCTISQIEDVGPPIGPPEGLPDAVVETRSAIMHAAVACDLDGLAALGGEVMHPSFGGETDAAAFWRRQQEAGEAPLDTLVFLLTLPPGGGGPAPDDTEVIWSWPRAYTDASDPTHRAELDDTFGREIVDTWFVPSEAGPGYYGPRVGIDADGTWMFYVAGD